MRSDAVVRTIEMPRVVTRRALAHILTIALFVVTMGCAAKPIQAPFDESQFEPYLKPGSGKILGSAFLKTRGGDVKFGAGNEVTLWPVTAYTTEVRLRGILRKERLEALDARLSKYSKQTMCDAIGAFEFDGLPAGSYYVMCPIYWEIAAGGYMTREGELVNTMLTVAEGETVKVILTGQ